MDQKALIKPLAFALGAAFATTLSGAGVASAADSPFAMTEMSGGYMVADAMEGKCGGDKKEAAEGKCGGEKKSATEGKCGEAKCGGEKKSAAEGKCGGSK